MVLAFLASLVGYALVSARAFRWRPEETLLPVSATIVSLLYALVFAGLLRSGAYAILLGGWIAFAVVVWRARHDDRSAIGQLATPGLLVFIGAAVLLWFGVRHASYAQWDEFSHWGLVTKAIVAHSALPTADSAVYFKGYPPGAALWHYFVTRIVPYSEGSVYFSHDLLLLAGLVLPLGGLGWRRWPVVLAGMLFGYLAIFTFGHGFQSVLSEHVLGVVFGGAVLWYVTGDGSRARLAAMAPILFCLPLLKEGGLLLAGLATGIVVSVELARLRAPAAQSRSPIDRFGALVLALSLLPAASLLSTATWAAHTRTLGVTVLYTSSMTVSRIRQTFSADRTERDRVILPKFREALSTWSIGNSRAWDLANGLIGRAGLLPAVPNGDFSAGLQGWRLAENTFSRVDNGRLRVKRIGGPDTAAMAMTTILTQAGQQYSVSCTYELGEAVSATLRIRTGPAIVAEATGTNRSGRLVTSFTATGPATTLDLYIVSPVPMGHGYFEDVRMVAIAGDSREGAALASGPTKGWRPRLPVIRPFVERPISTITWALILALTGLCLWRIEDTPDTRLRVVMASAGFAIGLVVYLAALLLVYLYGLSDYDARVLTSFGRYVGAYFMAWALVVFGLAMQAARSPRRRAAVVVTTSLTLLMLATAPRASADWLLDDQRLLPVRETIRHQMQQVDQYVPLDRSVAIIWQHTTGFEFWILRYELTPRITNTWNFAFGAPYYAGDVWTQPFSDEQFLQTIGGFDYVLIGRGDAAFWSRYGHLFGPEGRGMPAALFKVEKEPAAGVRLKMVTPL